MDIEQIRQYCLAKKGTTEGMPFNDTTLVFKVMGKMFCLLGLEPPHSINVKCDPEKAIELRDQYDDIKPGYHMDKRHWNTVLLNGILEEKMVTEFIDHSYDLVVAKLPKKDQAALAEKEA